MGRRPMKGEREVEQISSPHSSNDYCPRSLPPLPLPSFLRRKRCQLLPRPTMRRKPSAAIHSDRGLERGCVNSERVMFTVDVLMRHLPPCSLPSFIKTRRKEEVTERARAEGEVARWLLRPSSNEKETAQIQREERGRKEEARERKGENRRKQS